MKGKVSKNKFLKVVLPALLVVAIICQAVGFQAVLKAMLQQHLATVFQTLQINNYKH